MYVLHIIPAFSHHLPANLVYRVHWFQSKALLDRWEEVVELLQCEADWTRKYFQHRVNFWKDQQDEAVRLKNTGMACYAAWQCQIYHQLYLM